MCLPCSCFAAAAAIYVCVCCVKSVRLPGWHEQTWFPMEEPTAIAMLKEHWLLWKVMPWSMQSLAYVRHHYGEHIVMYYAFLGAQCLWLAYVLHVLHSRSPSLRVSGMVCRPPHALFLLLTHVRASHVLAWDMQARSRSGSFSRSYSASWCLPARGMCPTPLARWFLGCSCACGRRASWRAGSASKPSCASTGAWRSLRRHRSVSQSVDSWRHPKAGPFRSGGVLVRLCA